MDHLHYPESPPYVFQRKSVEENMPHRTQDDRRISIDIGMYTPVGINSIRGFTALELSKAVEDGFIIPCKSRSDIKLLNVLNIVK